MTARLARDYYNGPIHYAGSPPCGCPEDSVGLAPVLLWTAGKTFYVYECVQCRATWNWMWENYAL